MKRSLLFLVVLGLLGCTKEPISVAPPTLTTTPDLTWEIKSAETESYRYAFPHFTSGPNSIVLSLNQDLPSGVSSFVTQAEANFIEGVDPWELQIDPFYDFQDNTFVSLVLKNNDSVDGAQTNTYYGVINYHQPTSTFLRLEDLFTDDSYLESLSAFIYQEVSLQKQAVNGADYDPDNDEILRKGTEADNKNFKTFAFADGPEGRGLRFYFAPYQLGSYAEGSFEVHVPIGIINPSVRPEYQAWFDTAI